MNILKKCFLLAYTLTLFFGPLDLFSTKKSHLCDLENNVVKKVFEANKNSDIMEKIIFPERFLGNGNLVVIRYPHTALILKNGEIIKEIDLNPKKIENAFLVGFAVIPEFNLLVASVENDEPLNKKTGDMKIFHIFSAISGKCILECKKHKYPVFSFEVSHEDDGSSLLAYSPYDMTSSIYSIKKSKLNRLEIGMSDAELFPKYNNLFGDHYLVNTKRIRTDDKMYDDLHAVCLKDDINYFTIKNEQEKEEYELNDKILLVGKSFRCFFIKPSYCLVKNETIMVNNQPLKNHTPSNNLWLEFNKIKAIPAAIIINDEQLNNDPFREKIILLLGTANGSIIKLKFNNIKIKSVKYFETCCNGRVSVMEKVKGFDDILATGTNKGELRIWDLNTRKTISILNLKNAIVSFDSYINKNGIASWAIGLMNGKTILLTFNKNTQELTECFKKMSLSSSKNDNKKTQKFSDIKILFDN